jgi:hypothetical protein
MFLEPRWVRAAPRRADAPPSAKLAAADTLRWCLVPRFGPASAPSGSHHGAARGADAWVNAGAALDEFLPPALPKGAPPPPPALGGRAAAVDLLIGLCDAAALGAAAAAAGARLRGGSASGPAALGEALAGLPAREFGALLRAALEGWVELNVSLQSSPARRPPLPVRVP